MARSEHGRFPATTRVGAHDASRAGLVIPAHPLALTRSRKLDERRQRALTRYYMPRGGRPGGRRAYDAVRHSRPAARVVRAGASTRCAKRIAACDAAQRRRPSASRGICGATQQAVAEARLARELGYHAGLLSLAALHERGRRRAASPIAATVAREIPLVGFYLQPAAGGRVLLVLVLAAVCRDPERRRHQDRAVQPLSDARCRPRRRGSRAATTSRSTPATTTTSSSTLLTPFRFHASGQHGRAAHRRRPARSLGGLDETRGRTARRMSRRRARPAARFRRTAAARASKSPTPTPPSSTRPTVRRLHPRPPRSAAAPGLAGRHWCLDPHETLQPGQAEEIDRVCRAYPHLNDDEFVCQHLDDWLVMNLCPSTFQATLRLLWPSVALAAGTIAQEPDLIVHHGKIANGRSGFFACARRWPSRTA